MNGRAKSEEWLQYGPVYRIWAGPKPEMYVMALPNSSIITLEAVTRNILKPDSIYQCPDNSGGPENLSL